MSNEPAAAASAASVASVDRAIRILNAFTDASAALTLHDLSLRTGFYKSTILRLVATLIDNGCILRLDNGTYQPGPTLAQWGRLYLASVRSETHITPVLAKLAEATGESATFYARQSDETRICVARVDSNRSVRDHVRVGDIAPLGAGAGGKILLRFDPAARKTRPPEAMVIVSIGGRDAEIAGLGTPVYGAGGVLRGAMTVSGTATRFTEAVIFKFARLLLTNAMELTVLLGGDPEAHRVALASNPVRLEFSPKGRACAS